jgi:hypothetical protein
MNETQEQQQADFRTDDLAMAAFLHCEGYVFTVEALGRKAWFIFAPVDGLETCVDDYRDGVAEVEPRTFAQATGHCRRKMYDALGISRRNGTK